MVGSSETRAQRAPSVFITTENSRRISAGERVLPPGAIKSLLPLDEERAIRETETIAREKILSATQGFPIHPDDHFMSADALTYIGTEVARKPKSLHELQSNFAKIAQNDGEYDIRSHTVVAEPQRGSNNTLEFLNFPLGTRITLHPEKAAWLSTPEGTAAYSVALCTLYDSQVSYTKIASGICVMVLVSMGCVESIDNQPLNLENEAETQELLYSTAYTAIINIAPQALLYLSQKFEVPHHSAQDTQERHWQNLTHHPYILDITQKVWQTLRNDTRQTR